MSRIPRVLFDETLAVNPAGTGAYVRGLRDALAKRPEIELEMSALRSPALSGLDTTQRGLPVRLRNSLGHLRYYARVLPRRARELRCDIIYCPSPPVPLTGRQPFLMTAFDLTSLDHRGTQDRMSWLYSVAMLRRGVHRAAGICAISNAVGAELITHFGGLRARAVHTVYPGPNPELLAAVPVRPAIPDQPFVLMVGTMEPRKNHMTALRALALHSQHHPDSPLMLVAAGSRGWRYAPVLRAVDSLAIRDRVVNLDNVQPGVLKWLYQHARAVLFPSVYEGFGLPVLEALYLQCPVIAARIPSVIEIVGDERRLLAPMDVNAWATALDQLLDSAPDPAAAVAGLERARRFTWDNSAAAAIEALLASIT
jgi:glycosyltransferase involved in cell wall biosynthesis